MLSGGVLDGVILLGSRAVLPRPAPRPVDGVAQGAPRGEGQSKSADEEDDDGGPHVQSQAEDRLGLVDAQHLNPHPACGVDHEVDP